MAKLEPITARLADHSTTHSRDMEPPEAVEQVGLRRVAGSEPAMIHALPPQHPEDVLASRVDRAVTNGPHAAQQRFATAALLVGPADELTTAIGVQRDFLAGGAEPNRRIHCASDNVPILSAMLGRIDD